MLDEALAEELESSSEETILHTPEGDDPTDIHSDLLRSSINEITANCEVGRPVHI